MIVDDLSQAAMRLFGFLNPGRGASASQLSAAFDSLNEMVDAWAAERVLVYSIARATYPLVGSQQTYQIGPGAADFNTARPIRIEAASLSLNSNQYPMELLNERQWLDILQVSASGAYPRKLYNDSAFPVSTLYVWPVPSGTPSLILDTWQPLVSFDSQDSTVSLPPAFLQAVRFNLAVRYAREVGMTAPPEVAAQAQASLQLIAAETKAVQGMPNMATVDALGAPAPPAPQPGAMPQPEDV